MGWEPRGSNSYFYKKEREGASVKSVYVRRGKIAQMVAQIQSSSSLIERFARKMKSPQAIEQEKAEAALDQLTDRLIDPEIQHSKIVFDTGEITSVLCLFKVITRGCVFNQSAVNVIPALL